MKKIFQTTGRASVEIARRYQRGRIILTSRYFTGCDN